MATPESPFLAYLLLDPLRDTFLQSQTHFTKDPKKGCARIYNVGMRRWELGFRRAEVWSSAEGRGIARGPAAPPDAIRTDVVLAG